jgi:N-acylneuraminate cytidylyltransferase
VNAKEVTSTEVLAIIPARGGSKSIPRKNIRLFAGYPLIAYSITAGLRSKMVTRTILSTDDQEIAQVAQQHGAEVPFMRPVELAQDQTTDLPVFQHALAWLLEHEGYEPDVVVQLRPTSPLRPPDCVDRAVQLLLENPDADSVRGVVPAGQNPYKMWCIAADGRMIPLLTLEGLFEPFNAPRQSLPPVYWQTGHIDAIRTQSIYRTSSLSGDVILPLILDSRYTVDIDTLNDWRRAEWIVMQGELPIVHPGRQPRPLPDQVDLVVFDFDGVMTDNRVWVDEAGREMVAANRSDSMGLKRLLNAGVDVLVLSTETNPVVGARCRKLGISYVQGVENKASALRLLIGERGLDPGRVVYLGNDVNDVPCFPIVACAFVVADSQPEALRHADRVLSRRGGHGAVRELCDIVWQKVMERSGR